MTTVHILITATFLQTSRKHFPSCLVGGSVSLSGATLARSAAVTMMMTMIVDDESLWTVDSLGFDLLFCPQFNGTNTSSIPKPPQKRSQSFCADQVFNSELLEVVRVSLLHLWHVICYLAKSWAFLREECDERSLWPLKYNWRVSLHKVYTKSTQKTATSQVSVWS